MTNVALLKTVGICDTQPMTIEGLQSLLSGSEDLRMIGSATNLFSGLELVQQHNPSIVVIDKAFGLPAIMDWLANLRSTGTASVVWGVSMNEAEALRIMQAGAQGVMRKTADPTTVLACLRTVGEGKTWMEESLLGDNERSVRHTRSNLTPREQQVVELVEQGLKNKDIGLNMGIRPGTVKIHLKHIFEKTGIRGRYGLALSGLREKGLLSYPTV
jgi:Response regulator containing a CheY-like receiver domain and an HTH DNA-binding domain